ncbi:MAG: ATP-binding protein [Anaerolineaceae bacterium]
METKFTSSASPSGKNIGTVIGGSLSESLTARLQCSPQEIQEGGFVTIKSGDWQFYGLITDLRLGATDPRFSDEQIDVYYPSSIASALREEVLYSNAVILPVLMLENGPDFSNGHIQEHLAWKERKEKEDGLMLRPIQIKTIPAHQSPVRLASAVDIATVFGDPDEENNFVIGYTREQNFPVCIDLSHFIQRSAGIFGATGTGKSFLTRILLAGLIQQNKAALLIFDMHDEYGFDDTASDTGEKVTGLNTHFGLKVQVVSLGGGRNIHGNNPNFHVEIADSDIEPADIEMLTSELNLKETTSTTLAALVSSFGKNWFSEFKTMKSGSMIADEDGKKFPAPDSVAAWANQNGVNVMAAESLHNKLGRLFHAGYITAKPAANGLQNIVEVLKTGRHIILSFSRYDTDLDYLFISNLITRKIREEWETQTNAYRNGSSGVSEPHQLVIVVEEAHKLLNREMAAQTAFSTIAREMRKYYVTLLIIDQRPSQIYDEVMSQLGTRICGYLTDDEDIRAVLSGAAGKDSLRSMLSHLQPKEEVLIAGWGVPMPIPVRSRRLDAAFWEELDKNKTHPIHQENFEEEKKKLGF